jgi:hypothetical protein
MAHSAVSAHRRRDSTPHFLLIYTLWWSAAVDLLGKIDQPNNSKHDNDRSQTEPEHEPDIVPGHALSSLPRRDDGARFRILGGIHDVLLIRII